MVKIRTGDIETRASVEESGEFVGELPIIVTGGRQSDVLKTLTTLAETIEAFDTDEEYARFDTESERERLTTNAYDDGDEESGKSREGQRYAYDDSEVKTFERGDVWHVHLPHEERARALSPGSRPYQVLYHIGYYENEHGEPPTTTDITEEYDHMKSPTTTPAVSNLRRAGLIEATTDRSRGSPYTITRRGEEYIRTHGTPVGYEYPDKDDVDDPEE